MAEMRVTIDGAYDAATGTTTTAVPVSGSLTTTPSGTQDVNIVSSSSLSIAQPISTYAGADPTWTGVYFHAIVDSPGTVASNNYLAVLNPVGSGKIAIALGFINDSYSTGSVTAVQSLTAFRTTAQSAGTLIAAANVNRFVTSFPNPASEVRVGNPAVTTVGSKMIGLAPVIGGAANNGPSVSPTPGASFVFMPGEGIVFNVPAGDVQQFWNMQYVWAEKPL